MSPIPERNLFSIPQRLDILAAITEAAQRLSALRPLEQKKSPRDVPSGACRFASVAGAFFFPLMAAFDRPSGILDLRRDHIVLARLLLTLAIVLSCAEAAPGQAGMKVRFAHVCSFQRGYLCSSVLADDIPEPKIFRDCSRQNKLIVRISVMESAL